MSAPISLSECPWQSIQSISGYWFKFKASDPNTENVSYRFVMTNFVHVWYEEVDDTKFKDKIKAYSPQEHARSWADTDTLQLLKIVRTGLSAIDFNSQFKLEAQNSDLSLKMDIQYGKSKVPFTWKFICVLMNDAATFLRKEMIVPLVDIFQNQQYELKYLKQILNVKNEEIQYMRELIERYAPKAIFNAPKNESQVPLKLESEFKMLDDVEFKSMYFQLMQLRQRENDHAREISTVDNGCAEHLLNEKKVLMKEEDDEIAIERRRLFALQAAIAPKPKKKKLF